MKRAIVLLWCMLLAFGLTACKKFDSNYGKSTPDSNAGSQTQKEEIKTPEIKSDDEIMPSYVDISLYDEENYADIYLGEDFEFDVTYDGKVIEVPSSYQKMINDGWVLPESDGYNADSQILAGRSLKVNFTNSDNKIIVAVFYNNKKSSSSLKDCAIVKLVVKENVLIQPQSQYGRFVINGINNTSAITDMIEQWGSPSHFYRVSDSKYYIDWFITEQDRRSGITVYVDILEDQIESVEFSYY